MFEGRVVIELDSRVPETAKLSSSCEKLTPGYDGNNTINKSFSSNKIMEKSEEEEEKRGNKTVGKKYHVVILK